MFLLLIFLLLLPMQALEIEIPILYDSKPVMRKVEVDREVIGQVLTR